MAMAIIAGEMLPDHVGTALGDDQGGDVYFMVEVHYDNPEKLTCNDSHRFLNSVHIAGKC